MSQRVISIIKDILLVAGICLILFFAISRIGFLRGLMGLDVTTTQQRAEDTEKYRILEEKLRNAENKSAYWQGQAEVYRNSVYDELPGKEITKIYYRDIDKVKNQSKADTSVYNYYMNRLKEEMKRE